MPRATYIPITGSVLRWAIDQSGLSNSEFAQKVRTEPDNVQAWISGQAQPTKTQFNKIVSTLKRPSAAFFLPEPPQHLNLPPPLRRSVGARNRALDARELREIRWRGASSNSSPTCGKKTQPTFLLSRSSRPPTHPAAPRTFFVTVGRPAGTSDSMAQPRRSLQRLARGRGSYRRHRAPAAAWPRRHPRLRVVARRRPLLSPSTQLSSPRRAPSRCFTRSATCCCAGTPRPMSTSAAMRVSPPATRSNAGASGRPPPCCCPRRPSAPPYRRTCRKTRRINAPADSQAVSKSAYAPPRSASLSSNWPRTSSTATSLANQANWTDPEEVAAAVAVPPPKLASPRSDERPPVVSSGPSTPTVSPSATHATSCGSAVKASRISPRWRKRARGGLWRARFTSWMRAHSST